MKAKRLSIISIVALAIVFVMALTICLVLQHNTAYAYSGSGTEGNPYVVSTYSELKSLLESETDCYIVVNSFQKTNGKNYYQLRANVDYTPSVWGDIYGGAIKIPLGYTKHLTINADIDCRIDSMNSDTLLYSFINNRGNLYIDGNGSLSVGFNADNLPNSIIFNSNYLSIKGDVTFDATQKNLTTYGHVIYNYTGYFDIYRGTFIGNNSSNRDTIDAEAIYMYGNDGSHESTIYGGKFRSTKASYSTGSVFGLYVYDQEITQKINLAGGTFEGICLNDQRVTSHLSDIISDGCHYEKNGETYSYSQNQTVTGTIKVVNPARTISLVDLSVANPLHGTTKSDAETTTNHITVTDTEWNPDPESTGGTFIGGHSYEIKVRIKIEDGYTFADPTRVRINGSVVQNEDLSDYNYTIVSKYFEVDKPTPTVINNVAINVTSPINGGNPSAPTVTSDVYYVSAYQWTPNSTFVVGQDYTLLVQLRKVNESDIEHTFAGLTNATINGNNATITSAQSQYALVSYTFTVPTPQYTVSFNSNGGSGTMADDTNQFGGYALPTNGFTAPANKHFKAWALGSEDGDQYSVASEYDVTSNVTFYAIWENNAFTQQPISQAKNIDGGDKELSPDWDVNFVATKYEVMEGSTLIDTVTHKWFDISSDSATSRTFTIRAYYDETNYITSNQFTLTWTTNIRQVVYSPGDASGTNDLYEFVAGDTITIFGIDYIGFSYEGHTFDYWSIRNLGDSIEIAQKQPGDTYTVTNNTTIEAKWVAKTIDHLTAEYSENVVAGHTLDVSKMTIKLFYTDGTYITRDKYQAGFTIGVNPITIDEYVFETTGNVAITVTSEDKHATMNINVTGYNISFNANGGEGLMPSIENKYGNVALPTSTTFVAPEGKQFLKWAQGSASGTQYNGGTNYNVTENVTFYAIWADKVPQSIFATYGASILAGNVINGSKIDVTLTYSDGSSKDLNAGEDVTYWEDAEHQISNPTAYVFTQVGKIPVIVKYNNLQTIMNVTVVGYTVSFNKNAGEGEMTSQQNIFGTYILPACEFTAPDGKQFKGWALTSNGDVITTPSINITANTELFVIWEDKPAVTYQVSFDANGGTGTMITIQYAGTYTLPQSTFTAPSNKQFKGWALSANGEIIVGTTISVQSNTTLYAIWEDIPVVNPEPETPDPEQGGSGENGNNNSNSNSGNIESNSAKKPLSGGGIAGIVVAVVVVLAGAGVAVFFVLKAKGKFGKKETPKAEEPKEEDTKEE